MVKLRRARKSFRKNTFGKRKLSFGADSEIYHRIKDKQYNYNGKTFTFDEVDKYFLPRNKNNIWKKSTLQDSKYKNIEENEENSNLEIGTIYELVTVSVKKFFNQPDPENTVQFDNSFKKWLDLNKDDRQKVIRYDPIDTNGTFELKLILSSDDNETVRRNSFNQQQQIIDKIKRISGDPNITIQMNVGDQLTLLQAKLKDLNFQIGKKYVNETYDNIKDAQERLQQIEIEELQFLQENQNSQNIQEATLKKIHETEEEIKFYKDFTPSQASASPIKILELRIVELNQSKENVTNLKEEIRELLQSFRNFKNPDDSQINWNNIVEDYDLNSTKSIEHLQKLKKKLQQRFNTLYDSYKNELLKFTNEVNETNDKVKDINNFILQIRGFKSLNELLKESIKSSRSEINKILPDQQFDDISGINNNGDLERISEETETQLQKLIVKLTELNTQIDTLKGEGTSEAINIPDAEKTIENLNKRISELKEEINNLYGNQTQTQNIQNIKEAKELKIKIDSEFTRLNSEIEQGFGNEKNTILQAQEELERINKIWNEIDGIVSKLNEYYNEIPKINDDNVKKIEEFLEIRKKQLSDAQKLKSELIDEIKKMNDLPPGCKFDNAENLETKNIPQLESFKDYMLPRLNQKAIKLVSKIKKYYENIKTYNNENVTKYINLLNDEYIEARRRQFELSNEINEVILKIKVFDPNYTYDSKNYSKNITTNHGILENFLQQNTQLLNSILAEINGIQEYFKKNNVTLSNNSVITKLQEWKTLKEELDNSLQRMKNVKYPENITLQQLQVLSQNVENARAKFNEYGITENLSNDSQEYLKQATNLNNLINEYPKGVSIINTNNYQNFIKDVTEVIQCKEVLNNLQLSYDLSDKTHTEYIKTAKESSYVNSKINTYRFTDLPRNVSEYIRVGNEVFDSLTNYPKNVNTPKQTTYVLFMEEVQKVKDVEKVYKEFNINYPMTNVESQDYLKTADELNELYNSISGIVKLRFTANKSVEEFKNYIAVINEKIERLQKIVDITNTPIDENELMKQKVLLDELPSIIVQHNGAVKNNNKFKVIMPVNKQSGKSIYELINQIQSEIDTKSEGYKIFKEAQAGILKFRKKLIAITQKYKDLVGIRGDDYTQFLINLKNSFEERTHVYRITNNFLEDIDELLKEFYKETDTNVSIEVSNDQFVKAIKIRSEVEPWLVYESIQKGINGTRTVRFGVRQKPKVIGYDTLLKFIDANPANQLYYDIIRTKVLTLVSLTSIIFTYLFVPGKSSAVDNFILECVNHRGAVIHEVVITENNHEAPFITFMNPQDALQFERLIENSGAGMYWILLALRLNAESKVYKNAGFYFKKFTTPNILRKFFDYYDEISGEYTNELNDNESNKNVVTGIFRWFFKFGK
jgi:hypothetical protein